MADRIWITWENQRRSRELAAHFGCALFEFTKGGALRYPRCIVNTVAAILRHKPRVVFVQNPSMVLATLVVLLSKVTGQLVVVDRHTTFLLNRKGGITLGLLLFKAMHWFTLRYADLTIVTNAHLAGIVRSFGGRAVVLPDKLPSLPGDGTPPFQLDASKVNILFIASFASDEPIEEVCAAMQSLEGRRDVHMYISGRIKPKYSDLVERAPRNVTFTNYLPEAGFIALLKSVDVVLALTTLDHTMLCGCYEGVAAEKVLVTSEKAVLREYFTEAIFAENSARSIASALSVALDEKLSRQARIRELRQKIQSEWPMQAIEVNSAIEAQLRS